MATINTETPVLVTGGTGYLAGGIIKQLLDAGVTVHTTVRNLANTKRYSALLRAGESSAGSIKFFEADLLKEGSFAEAMKGCTTVFHTASPFPERFKDPQKELIEPAVNGTKNVLNQVNQTGTVKRVVLTSSTTALHTDAKDVVDSKTGVLNEDCWNTTASIKYQPYAYSKLLAEKAAWEIAKAQSNWDLVVINPGLILGPCAIGLQESSQSIGLIKSMGDGTFKSGCPELCFAVTDLREVAKAHVEAAFRPEAKGRYMVCKHETDFFEMSQILQEKYGDDYALPKSSLPKFFLWAFGPFIDSRMTRKFVSRNVAVRYKVDPSKVEQELGIQFRALKKTLNDTFQQLVDAGILEAQQKKK